MLSKSHSQAFIWITKSYR